MESHNSTLTEVSAKNLSIIIIAYNEELLVENTVAGALTVLHELKVPFELIIVDDGSTDRTHEIIQRLAQKNSSMRILKHETNLGMGAAIKTGYQKAKHEWACFLPADGQISPEILKQFYREIQNNEIDVVTTIYTKRHDHGFRLFLSKGFRFVLHGLFGYFPPMHGVYMFRRKILEKITLTSTSFVLNFEFMMKAYTLGCRFKEIHIICLPRTKGKSKVTDPKKILYVFAEIVGLRLRTLRGFSRHG